MIRITDPKDLSWPQPNLRCQFKLGLPAGYHFTDDQLDMAIKESTQIEPLSLYPPLSPQAPSEVEGGRCSIAGRSGVVLFAHAYSH